MSSNNSNINMIINAANLYYGDGFFQKAKSGELDQLIDSLSDDNFLGLGKDSVKFEAKPKITGYNFNGKGDRNVKNMEEITGWEVKATGSIIDLNDKVLEASLIKKDIEHSTQKYGLYIPDPCITDDTYHDLLIIGTMKNNPYPVAIAIKNAFNHEGFSIEMKDKDNAAAKMTFNGSYDLKKLDEPPFLIIKPEFVASVDSTGINVNYSDYTTGSITDISPEGIIFDESNKTFKNVPTSIDQFTFKLDGSDYKAIKNEGVWNITAVS